MGKKIKRMWIKTIGLALLACLMIVGEANAFGPSTMYSSPSTDPGPGTLYPRAIRLQYNGTSNGTMLATFEHYVNGTPTFPVYRSTDGGVSWSKISEVSDTVNGWGLRYQPFLYELPQAIGSLPAGTLLCAGNSIPSDLSQTKLDLYKSTDKGLTWTFVSSIATGGRADPSGAYDPVWEPFLLVANNKLIMYYSDERDAAHNQKLVHVTSTNGTAWSTPVEDIALADSTKRPGMTTVAKLGNGNYIMTYEYGGSPNGNFAVYYKISSNPENFGAATDPGTLLKTRDGVVPSSSPYVVWVPGTGPNGTIAVTTNSSTELFLNSENGASDTWTRVSTVVPQGYSRAILPLADNHSVLILSGGPLGSGHNSVTYGSKDLGDAALLHQIESSRYAGYYIRHYNFLARIDTNPSPINDSKFRMVPGLADSTGVSFESVNFPGYYLRHYNYVMQLSRNDGTTTFQQDATFYQTAGLANSSQVSFRSYNFPTYYLRQLSYTSMRIDPISASSATADKQDATFIIH
ncbi:alpha-L-arabinofuranosidase B-like protein [Paenibacillus sp. BK033]|uniref:AbfB domain-containing protein n=1 Tax=Paenibacillus sp. BK033 TaxID=2512133 RepID=UPI001049906E|nr:AbfB domain-containing protein [Paenibacillus sp. BK033]TCN01885.1 alpha-L-arabinofuranosidase B-like protein [Paenibacillus sp. BK033]